MISKNIDIEKRFDYSYRAAKDFAKKVRLEKGFRKDLKAFFEKITDKFKSAYSESGQVPPANIFEPELRAILDKNYKYISKNFDSQLRMESKLFDYVEFKGMDDDISNTLRNYISRHSKEQAGIITTTNQDEMADAIKKVKTEALNKGVVLSNKEIATQAAFIFKKRCLDRVDTIATTETQNISENTKYIEATFVDANISNGLYQLNLRKRGKKAADGIRPMNNLIKTWVTILDEKTRMSHVLADEQQQPTNTPFLVEGDKMMTPGDGSLGAKPGNLINCRCSCIYDVSDDVVASFARSGFESYSPPAESMAAKYPELDQHRIVENIKNGIPVGPDPNIIIIKNFEEEYGAIQGRLFVTDEVSRSGYVITKDVTYDKDTFPSPGTSLGLYYKDKTVGYFFVDIRTSNTHKSIYVRPYINLNTTEGREAFEKIKNGQIKGFGDLIGDPKEVETISRSEAINRGYVISDENSAQEIKVYKKLKITGADLTDEALLFKESALDPVPINRPIPADIKSLDTPDFIVPDNIKNGENVTIVEGIDGKKYGFVRGYAAVYDVPNTHRFLTLKGAYDDDIKGAMEKYNGVAMHYNHDVNEEIAGIFPYKNMRNDDYGLYVEGFIDLNTEKGRRLYKEAKEGKIPAFSMGGGIGNTRAGLFMQDVIPVERSGFAEISIVTEPANRKAVMMPVIGQEALVRRAVGDDVFKAITPELPKINLNLVKTFQTQEELDEYFLNIRLNTGVNLDTVKLDILKDKKQAQVDTALQKLREAKGLDFYVTLNKFDQYSYQATQETGIRYFDELDFDQRVEFLDSIPSDKWSGYVEYRNSIGYENAQAYFNRPEFNGLFEKVQESVTDKISNFLFGSRAKAELDSEVRRVVERSIEIAERNDTDVVDLIKYSLPSLSKDEIEDILKEMNYVKKPRAAIAKPEVDSDDFEFEFEDNNEKPVPVKPKPDKEDEFEFDLDTFGGSDKAPPSSSAIPISRSRNRYDNLTDAEKLRLLDSLTPKEERLYQQSPGLVAEVFNKPEFDDAFARILGARISEAPKTRIEKVRGLDKAGVDKLLSTLTTDELKEVQELIRTGDREKVFAYFDKPRFDVILDEIYSGKKLVEIELETSS